MPASRLAHWLLFTLALFVALVGTALLLVDSRWGEERARRFVVSRVSEALVGDLSIDRLSGSMIGGDVRLEGVTLTHEGVPVVSAEEVRVRYSLPQMFSGVTVAEVVINRPRIILVQDLDTGEWNVTQLTGDTEPGGSRPAFTISRLTVVDGQVEVRPRDAEVRRVTALTARLGIESTTEAFRLDIGQLSARDADTDLTLRELSGEVRFGDRGGEVAGLRFRTASSTLAGDVSWQTDSDGTADVQVRFDVRATPLRAQEFRPYVPALNDMPDDSAVTLHARGSLRDFTVDWRLASDAGRAEGQAAGTLHASMLNLTGSVEAEGFDPARWANQPALAGDVDVSGTFDARLPIDTPEVLAVEFGATVSSSTLGGYRVTRAIAKGRYTDDTLHALVSGHAYGAAVDLDAEWHPSTREWRAEGRFASVNVAGLPARLGAPRLASDLSGRVRLNGGESAWSVDAVLSPSTLEGAEIADGFAAAVASDGTTLAYDVHGSVRDLDPRRILILLLDDPPDVVHRLAGTIAADLDLEGRGTELASATAAGEIWLHDWSVPGLMLDETHVTAALEQGALEAEIEVGRVAVSENPLGFDTGPIEAIGTLAAHVRVPDIGGAIPLEAVEADGTLALSGMTARDVVVDRADLMATLSAGALHVAQLDVTGPALRADASGVVALAGEGSSDLAFSISASDLAAFGRFTDQPLAGGATITGRLTGPARQPSARGTFEAHAVTGGPVTALSVASQFTATLPDLAFEQAVGTMDATATFVEISGTRIDELVADVAFDAGRVVLDLMVAQGSREFEIAGDLVPHPDHREVHLQRLALRAGGAVWQLQAEEAVIQYAPGRVEVRDLALVSGAGFLRIEGAFGEGSEAPLTVTTENVRLQDLNEMALGTHTFEGSLDMTAVVTGTMAAPIVQADLVVDGGSIDGQPFRSVTGSGGFRDHQVSLDFEMDAGAFGFLTATGTLPLAAGAPEGTTLTPYDVTVRSTALDLTFLQPLTSTIEELAGTGTVDLRVEGDAEAPAINGTVTLSDVGFMVPATGVAYQRLNADLAIQGQQLVVEQLALEDADGNPATVSGVLDLPGVADRNTFELVVSTDELVVLDNDLGEIAVSVNLQALGDLQTPLLAGTITVDRGVVEVSDLLEQLSSSGYEAAPVEETAETTDLSDASPYERSSLSVTLAVPGNLVVRGRDLRGGRGPIGLGDVNVTLQGALLIAKETGEEPTLIGTVDVIRGQYDFQGRQFTIARGSQIAFQGTTSNPALDVSAERVVSGVTATVHLGGTLARPEIELSSSPMLDQGDILSLIVFNQPMNALPTAERVSLGARAAALAASAIATPLADSVARALDLDVFEIQPTAEAGGGASVRIGRQVGDNLFLGVSQEFGREDVTQVSFEYRLNEYISIITSVSHGSGGQTSALRRAQEAGIDLIYTRR